jgi:hypothetical protein
MVAAMAIGIGTDAADVMTATAAGVAAIAAATAGTAVEG